MYEMIIFENKCNFEPFLVTTESLDSWLELEDWRKVIFKDNSCFDLFFLIKNMTTDLNNAKSNNPLPRYPLNPFTQKVYSNDELSHIRSLCNDNYVNLNPVLNLFLSDSANWNNNSNWSNRFIDYLENKNLRFVRLNNILGNELHCIGYWDKKNTPHSKTSPPFKTRCRTCLRCQECSLCRIAPNSSVSATALPAFP